MSALEWRRDRRRILLPVLILRPFPVTDLAGEAATALLDTGSSVSGIASRVAERFGLRAMGKRPLLSAQGEGQVERYAFRIGLTADSRRAEPPSFPFLFDEVIGIELTNAFEFDALLGMDILSRCDFSMSRSGVCRLDFG
ncbi:MAG: aspartyl protease family protein [Allosphingosinicella sp.]